MPTSKYAVTILTALALAGNGCGGPPGPEQASASSLRSDEEQGSAAVQLFVNSSPVILDYRAEQRMEVGAPSLDVLVHVDAMDPDGDDLRYGWTAPGCPGATIAPGEVAPEGAQGSGRADARVHVPVFAPGCAVELEVRDAWKDGQPPAGSGLPVERGGVTRLTLTLSPPP